MYGVNAGVPKTLIQYLIRYMAALPQFKEQQGTLVDIIDTPISPELTPADSQGQIAQKTEDLVGRMSCTTSSSTTSCGSGSDRRS